MICLVDPIQDQKLGETLKRPLHLLDYQIIIEDKSHQTLTSWFVLVILVCF